MQTLIDYINAGGTWTWVSLGAGVLGMLSLIRALFADYRKGPAIVAAELGFVALLAAGYAWYQAKDAGTVALESAHGSQVAALTAETVVLRRQVPIRVGLGAGLPPLVLGLLIAGFSGATRRGARQ